MDSRFEGIVVYGYYLGCKTKTFQGDDGKVKYTYEVGVIVGETDSMTVRVDSDVTGQHVRMDYVALRINRMSAYGGKVYMYGEFLDLGAEDVV